MIDLLKFDLTAQNRTAGSFDRMKKDLGGVRGALVGVNDYARRTGRSMRNIGAGLSAGVTAPLTLLGKQSVQLYDQQVKAENMVAQAITSTGSAAGKTLGDLKGLASGLQAVTVFGDEDILENVTAPLLTFTKVQDATFDRAQANVLDMATLLKMDLKSASILVGKALNDPIKGISALGRSGVQFSEDQKSVIKALVETGDVAGAQAVILGELETQFKGQAAMAAAAPLGQWRQLSNAIGDVKEELGAQIVPFLKPLVENVKDTVNWFAALSPEVKKNIVVIGGLAAAAGPVLGILGLATMGIAGVTGALSTMGAALLANPAIAVIALIAGGAYLIYRNWDGITAWFGRQWDGIKSLTSRFWEWLKTYVPAFSAAALIYEHWDGIAEWFGQRWQDVKSGIAVGWDAIAGLLSGRYSPGELIHKAWSGLGDWFAGLAPGLAQGFVDLWSAVKLEISQWPGRMLQTGKDMIASLITGFSSQPLEMPTPGQMGAQSELYGQAGAAIRGRLTGTAVGDGLAAGLSDSDAKVRAAARELGGNMTSEMEQVLGIESPSKVFKGIGQNVMEGLGLGLEENRDVALDAMRGIAGDLTGIAQTASQSEGVFRNAFQSFVTGATSAKDAARNLLGELSSLLANRAFSSIWSGSGIGGALGGLFGFSRGAAFSGGRVVPFASGGVVSGPTTFPMRGGTGLMGEAGPEAIMPLSRMPDGKLGVQAQGGGGRAGDGGFARIEVVARVEDGNIVQTIEQVAGNMVVRVMHAGMREQHSQLPGTLSEISKRGTAN